MSETLHAFKSQEEATQWMESEVDDTCVDNERFAYKDDPLQMAKYQEQVSQGCCGFFDEDIEVNGRAAIIGCNFGH